ncbi:MAG: SDR family NAD(P)-dependent oxidoreductase [Treponema sp.]|jgi:short-subunit dehydrogenase|nr:SDR family NAD(P)-dependent oxidoreductase [Treponema sp.]
MKTISIVTGASSGIGKEFVRLLFKKGTVDELWLIARRKDKLEELTGELKATGSEQDFPVLRILALDISGSSGAKAVGDLIKKTAAAGGITIRMLINGAGFGTYGTFESTDLDRELDMIELNCVTLTALCGYTLPYMQQNSIIINIASLASFLPLGNFAVYGATKSYVLSFSLALAAETADRGIRICALCPGPVNTEFAQVASNGARTEVLHGLPADKVAAHCLHRAERGKHTAIMAFKWKFKAAASRFVGRYAGARFTYKYCKRPSNPQ